MEEYNTERPEFEDDDHHCEHCTPIDNYAFILFVILLFLGVRKIIYNKLK